MDYEAARLTMVNTQVRPNDVNDWRIRDAMAQVPRECFVPEDKRAVAYADYNIEVASGRVLMEPRCFAKLLQAAEIDESDLILDVACGLGYSTAVLASLGSAVVALESDEALAKMATSVLTDLGVDNAAVVEGPLREGYPRQGPFDVVFISGGVEVVPESLLNQLRRGGRLAAVVDVDGGHARIFSKNLKNGRPVISSRIVFDAFVPVLPGFERQEEFVF